MRVLIVGGTGAVGQALVTRLHEHERAPETTVVSRTHDSVPGAHRVIRGHFADLASSETFRRELGECAAVVHLGDGLQALLARGRTGDTDLAERLTNATRRLALAVRDCRVPVFVYLSSIRAVAGEDDERVLTEDSEPRGAGLYGRTKLRIEHALEDVFCGSATRCVCLRTPAHYGIGGGGNLLRLLRLADTPYALPFGGLTNRRSLVSLRNFADATAQVLFNDRGPRERAPGTIYHIHDGGAVSTTEIVTVFRAALGRPRRLFHVPQPAVRLARPMPIAGPLVRRLFGSLELSDLSFRRTFGWVPCEDTTTALTDMARAYMRQRDDARQ